LPVQILCLGILIPIAEEVMFRGVIFARFRVTLSFWKAAFYATLLFSFSHSNLVQFLYAFCVGLLLAFVYERYQTLWAPILLHICLNLTSLLVTAGKGFDWLVAQPLRMCVLAVVCTFAGSVLVMQMQQSKENKVVEVE
jgi:membrane protease YdiL (CAAX protease family)